MIRLTFLLALFAGVVAMAIRPEPAPRKRLIEFGWDSPDPHFMRTHIAELQASPFDGCVFHVPYFEPGGRTGDFTWELWGRRRFTRAELDSARRDLLATRFGRFRDNFLRVNTTPGNLDWFEDHSAVLSNLELAASLAREAGAPGVLLDPEQYQGQLWDYSVQRRATGRNWDQLAAQVRRRGAEVMRALERGYPGLTVFMTFAYSLPLHETIGGRGALTGAHNGLLAPFLDGMLEAARDSTRIVDGHELSYSYRDPARFAAQADSMRRGVLRLVADPARYRRRMSVGFGIWLDFDSPRTPWQPAEVSRNYFTPESFGRAVQAALDNADEYVWIYGEKPRWWTVQGRPQDVPAAYDSVLRAVRR
ncbi:MAG: hypothetical protein IT347_03530 [Candidatus Eisenbacteria bacterium]|nr:hypothetical protein [Candidatus Eisenbacteria bacterium]